MVSLHGCFIGRILRALMLLGYFKYIVHACEPGRFGENCSKMCHCINNETCNEHTGQCNAGCHKRYTGDACQQPIQCPLKDTFGLECNKTCHCAEGGKCHPITGNCTSGCMEGWEGDGCQVNTEDDETGQLVSDETAVSKDDLLILLAAGLPAVFIIIVAIIVCTCCRKKPQSLAPPSDNIAMSSHMTEESVADVQSAMTEESEESMTASSASSFTSSMTGFSSSY